MTSGDLGWKAGLESLTNQTRPCLSSTTSAVPSSELPGTDKCALKKQMSLISLDYNASSDFLPENLDTPSDHN